MNCVRYIIILSRISVSFSRFRFSSRCHYYMMFVVGSAFLMEDWHVRYIDMIVILLWSLPFMDIYDHLPNPWKSLPEVVIDPSPLCQFQKGKYGSVANVF